MTLPAVPSKPISSEGNLGAILQWVMTKGMQRMDGMLPAVVLAYDRVANRAQVQPLIPMLATSGNSVARAPIASVPVLALGGGGFFVNFPLAAGDVGWIEASDRDISNYLQSMSAAIPNTKRMHSFEDGRFVPDVYGKYSFAPTAGAMVISSLDGTTRIEMSPGKISLSATEIDLNGTTVNVNASGTATLNAASLNINTTSGTGTTATGYFNLPTHTTIAGRDFLSHEHSGVQSGSNNSGGVV